MNPRSRSESKSGYLLFYVMGILALLGFFAAMALIGARMESRSARNNFQEVQALYHAEAGARLVRAEVERRLEAGLSLTEALTGLRIEAPADYEFDTIESFTEQVPDILFQFTSVGRSGDARVVLEVQYRRDPLFRAGLFGVVDNSSQPGITVYGYDSRRVSDPSPADSNGKATIGSNVLVDMGNHFSLDGEIILGEDGEGNPGSVTNNQGYDTLQVGPIEEDPWGINGGALAVQFDRVRAGDNDNGLVRELTGGILALRPNASVTFTAGEYYFSELYTPPNVDVFIDTSEGPVRFYVEGEVDFQPQAMASGSSARDFHIYSNSTELFRIQPRGDFATLIYAPNTTVDIWPNGDFLGGVWADTLQMQPGGTYYVDTSIMDSYLSDELTVHAWFESREL